MADRTHLPLLYHFTPRRPAGVAVPFAAFARRLGSAFAQQQARAAAEGRAVTWEAFVENLHALDWFMACACLEGMQAGWESLFSSRASRTDSLLVDALRSRAVRLFPRDVERQEEAVMEFWGYLLAGE